MWDEGVSEIVRTLVWLGAYAAAASCLAGGLFLVAWRPAAGTRAAPALLRLLLATGVLPLLDVGQLLGAGGAERGRILIQALLLGVGLVWARLVWRFYNGPPARLAWARLRVSACLLAAGLPTVFWASHRLHETPVDQLAERTDRLLAYPHAENLEQLPQIDLRTDRGARIPAYRFVGKGEVSESELVAEFRSFEPSNARMAIERAPADLRANCHGWVFAAGEFIIRGAEVDQILQDNGYRPTSEPRPGDLIVYRDSDNKVLHTGVVKAAGRDGFLLIESKWGLHGRFLHEPQQQSYSNNFAYFRSPRIGHGLDRAPSTGQELPGQAGQQRQAARAGGVKVRRRVAGALGGRGPEEQGEPRLPNAIGPAADDAEG